MRRVSIFCTAGALLAFSAVASGAETTNLYPLFHDKAVKVHVAEVKDSTKEHEIDPTVIKRCIEQALKNRKSIRFDVVQDPSQAELQVDMDVTDFLWTDHDPADMLVGAAAIAYDIATIEDYARLQADMSVTDLKSGQVLWKERVMATITKKPMSRAQSIPLVAGELAKTFVKECFSKRR
jgi:hypothetical protein